MIKTKPWTGGVDEEYETQHFGFGAQQFKIALRKMVEETISSLVKSMESYLQETLDLNDTDKATMTHVSDKLIRLYCERAGPSLEVIDGEIEPILKVPANVLLPDDEVQLEQVTDAEYEKLKDDVASLRISVERGASMEVLLKAEEEEFASVEKVCETAKKDMEITDLLSKNIQGNSLKSVLNETKFLCAKLPFLGTQDYECEWLNE